MADEVRSLSHRSAQAANETAQLIQDTIERVKKGNELNFKLAESFTKVNQSAGQVATLIHQIDQATKDQSKGVDQINTAITQMDQVVQQSAAGAEESASASEELASQAQVLRQTVNQLAALVEGGRAKEVDSQEPNTGSRFTKKNAGQAPTARPGKVSVSQKPVTGKVTSQIADF